MTDHDDHHHHGEDHDGDGIPERSAHGIPHPPAGLEQIRAMGAALPATTMPLHHWAPGPQDLVPVARPYLLKLRDGSKVRITHRFYWYLDRVEGTTKRKALNAIYAVLLNGRSWSRAGIHWVRTFDRNKANVWVRIIPAASTVCGPQSAGCYHYGYEPKPCAETGVEYIDRPGPFAVIFGMETQGHAAVRGHDQYIGEGHQPYVGVMGTWSQAAAVGWYPADHEIESARQWVRGETPSDRIHWHN